MRGIWTVIKKSVNDFLEDDAMTLAGALAFYTALSLAPLLVLILWLVGLIWGGKANEQVITQAQAAMGQQGAEMVRTVIEYGNQPGTGLVAKVAGIVTLLLGATGVFAQLQYSLNRIWDVEARPGQGTWNWIRKRFLSLGMVVAIAFILLVSLVITGAMLAVFAHLSGNAGEKVLWRILELAASVVIYFLLFAVTFKVLPDVKIGWRDVLLGSLITAALFAIGKYLIGLYIGRSGTESVYGAAGSLMVMLLWVYYSALIVFFGAELTQAYARHSGRQIEPNDHAVPIGKKVLCEGDNLPEQGPGKQ